MIPSSSSSPPVLHRTALFFWLDVARLFLDSKFEGRNEEEQEIQARFQNLIPAHWFESIHKQQRQREKTQDNAAIQQGMVALQRVESHDQLHQENHKRLREIVPRQPFRVDEVHEDSQTESIVHTGRTLISQE